MRIVLTGGGTGGHVFPNMAVIEEFKKRVPEILYIGSKGGIEKDIVEKAGVRFEGVHCGKMRRYLSFQNVLDFFKVPVGIFQALRLLKKFSPDVVFSKGGYVSFPVVVAANRLHIPVIAHESDISPGLANKLSFKFASTICTSFKETASYIPKKFASKIVHTGPIIRSEIFDGSKDAGLKFTGLDRHRPVVLIMGGSMGAEQINNLVKDSLDELLKKFQIVHIVGRGNLDIGVHKRGYAQYEFLDEPLHDVYAMSEMVVCRGGANSLAELAFLKKKALIIPISTEASRGEQSKNAQLFAHKLGWSILEGEISRADFIDNIKIAFENRVNDDKDFKNGLKPVVQLILKYKK